VSTALAAAAVAGALGVRPPLDGRTDLSAGLLGLLGAWALAVVLGVVSLLQYDRKQLFAAWGLILAAVTGPLLLITAGLVWGPFN
jgi:hypothetical protein